MATRRRLHTAPWARRSSRCFATLAGLLCAVGAVVFGVTNGADREVSPPAGQSLPSLSAPGRLDTGGAVDRGAVDDTEDGDLDGRTVSVASAEPAVRRLDPDLLAALRAAAGEAAEDGIEARVSSGWRSRDYQQRLLDEAIVTYGSRQEALRWVSTPDTSAHTTGHAIDVSPTEAAYWMSEHGAEFGLCQTYANEIWHYERLTSPGGTCPTPKADSLS